MYAAEHARHQPDKPAFVFPGSGEIITFGEYEQRANRFAHYLRQQGLRRGDHIAVFMENHPRFFELQGGAERAGLYYTLVNSYLGADEVAYIVENCQARVLVTSPAKLDVATAASRSCPGVEHLLVVDAAGPPPPFESYEAVTSPMPSGPIPDEELGAAMLYSSGTTGRPKGILRPLPEAHPADPLPVMAFVANLFRVREGMTYLSPAPLYHSAPQANVSCAVRLGATSVVMDRFDPESFLRLVAEYRATHSQMVPTMFSRLLKLPAEVRTAYDTSSIEVIVHAAAPCPPPVKKAMIDWLGPVLVEYYGATEANGFTFCDSREWLAHPGTVGRAVLGEIHILDDGGRECAVGEEGTVWFAGATNFEYFNEPEKTTESRDATGNMSTVGDVGRLDDDGYLYLTDRKSYMIISGGVNIYPQEAENLLVTHPKVADAAVIGVPNDDLGEEVKAVVQLMAEVGAGPDTEAELIAFCRAHLAHFKCPRSVDFVTELPRLPTGKLYKRLLRESYWAGHGTHIV